MTQIARTLKYQREADPEWYTIESTSKQDFEVWFQNGIVQYYKLRSQGQEAVLKQ